METLAGEGEHGDRVIYQGFAAPETACRLRSGPAASGSTIRMKNAQCKPGAVCKWKT